MPLLSLARSRIWTIVLLCVIAGLALIAFLGQVPTAISAQDRHVVEQKFGLGKKALNLPGQIEQIAHVQARMLQLAPIDKGLPLGGRRELTDVVDAGYGLCFDRSRAMETVFQSMGYDTRHVSIYDTTGHQAVAGLLTPNIPSHAVMEVRTAGGWLVVDSNDPWLGLTKAGEPKSTAEVVRAPGGDWYAGATRPAIYATSPKVIYGLYSRHGMFYPPYTPVPDFDLRQLSYNL